MHAPTLIQASDTLTLAYQTSDHIRIDSQSQIELFALYVPDEADGNADDYLEIQPQYAITGLDPTDINGANLTFYNYSETAEEAADVYKSSPKTHQVTGDQGSELDPDSTGTWAIRWAFPLGANWVRFRYREVGVATNFGTVTLYCTTQPI